MKSNKKDNKDKEQGAGEEKKSEEKVGKYSKKDLAYLIAIAIITIINLTITLNKLVGENVMGMAWYWTSLLSVITLILIGVWTGNINRTALKKAAIVVMVISFVMMPLTAIFGPKANAKELASWMTSDTTPPRNVAWMNRQITTVPQQVFRVYNGDEFEYSSSQGFWIVEGYNGRKFFHNPCVPGETRSFTFYELPREGTPISIQGAETFEMRFRVSQPRSG